jgi:hypothetical protein
LRGFADEVRQFLLRAQEGLRSPDDIVAAADRRGLTGWHELARFLGEYQTVMDDLGWSTSPDWSNAQLPRPAKGRRCSTMCSSTTIRTPPWPAKR